MKKNLLKQKYGNEEVFVLPYNLVEHIQDKFNLEKHTVSIYTKYSTLGKYLPRYEVECNPSFQQIIPYFFITNEDNSAYYVCRRIAGDHRLVNKMSLGFGGHINPCDGLTDQVLRALIREMHEELEIEIIKPITYMGTMRDVSSETNDHFGLVFSVTAKESSVEIKETDKLVGEWMTLEEIYDNYSNFEGWSKYIIDYFYSKSPK